MKETKVVNYICEVCGKSSTYKSVIERCEEIHNCKCKSIIYTYNSYLERFEMRCIKCKQEQAEVINWNIFDELGDFLASLPSDVIEPIFHYLKK